MRVPGAGSGAKGMMEVEAEDAAFRPRRLAGFFLAMVVGSSVAGGVHPGLVIGPVCGDVARARRHVLVDGSTSGPSRRSVPRA